MGRWAQARRRGSDRPRQSFAFAAPQSSDWSLFFNSNADNKFDVVTFTPAGAPPPDKYLIRYSIDGGAAVVEGPFDFENDNSFGPEIAEAHIDVQIAWCDTGGAPVSDYGDTKQMDVP